MTVFHEIKPQSVIWHPNKKFFWQLSNSKKVFRLKSWEEAKEPQIVLHAVLADAMRHWTWDLEVEVEVGLKVEVELEAEARMAMSSIDGGIRNSSPNDELKTQFMTR